MRGPQERGASACSPIVPARARILRVMVRNEEAGEPRAIYALRPWGPTDFGQVREVLRAGYPHTPGAFWDAALERLRSVPPGAADDPLGALLERHGRPVGVALLLPSRRPGPQAPLHINASSWVVLPEARTKALWAAGRAMDRSDAVYTALTPNAPTVRMLERLGFRPLSHQCVLTLAPRVARWPGPAARVQVGRPALAALRDDPLLGALEDHHRLGCTITAVETAGGWVPMVWRTRWFMRLLRAAELLYTPSVTLALAHAPALARALLPRAYAALAIEAPEHCAPDLPCTRLFQRRFARGPAGGAGIDHLYSELVYLR